MLVKNSQIRLGHGVTREYLGVCEIKLNLVKPGREGPTGGGGHFPLTILLLEFAVDWWSLLEDFETKGILGKTPS